jgi:antibiotic biosynthesis monooxygenase (ABM) superfamily enzyme
MSQLHVAVTRKVRPGMETAFESAIHEFFEQASELPGTTGAYLLRPLGQDRSYGILRAFDSDADRDAFYASEVFKRWDDRVAPLVEGPAERRPMHGLEAFFRGAGDPPAWKMAVLTWLAVNPAVWIWANGVPSVYGGLPPLVELVVVNFFVVVTLTWAFMPFLVHAFQGWLSAGEQA